MALLEPLIFNADNLDSLTKSNGVELLVRFLLAQRTESDKPGGLDGRQTDHRGALLKPRNKQSLTEYNELITTRDFLDKHGQVKHTNMIRPLMRILSIAMRSSVLFARSFMRDPRCGQKVVALVDDMPGADEELIANCIKVMKEVIIRPELNDSLFNLFPNLLNFIIGTASSNVQSASIVSEAALAIRQGLLADGRHAGDSQLLRPAQVREFFSAIGQDSAALALPAVSSLVQELLRFPAMRSAVAQSGVPVRTE